MPVRRVARATGPVPGPLPRGLALAGTITALTALGHLAGGGSLPGMAILVVLFPLLAFALAGLAERARSAGGTLLTLAAGQLAMHELLVLLGHEHAAERAPAPSATTMLAMHAVATLCSAVLLREIDRILVTLAAALSRALPRRPAPSPARRPLPACAVPAPGVVGRVHRATVAVLAGRAPPVATTTR